MKYTLGSGYYKDEAFAKIWVENLVKRATPSPNRIVVISVGGASFPAAGTWFWQISLPGNLGHVGDLLKGKDRDFCGWSASVLALAMIAYCNETDFIFIESDVLAFGPWVEQMYKDMGEGDMVFGGKMESEPFMYCAQGLFLVRHRFIPTFVSEFLRMGPDGQRDSEGKTDNLPEDKFHRLREMFPDKIKTLSFGVDRMRPLPIDSPVWYAQHFTPEELNLLHEKGLL